MSVLAFHTPQIPSLSIYISINIYTAGDSAGKSQAELSSFDRPKLRLLPLCYNPFWGVLRTTPFTKLIFDLDRQRNYIRIWLDVWKLWLSNQLSIPTLRFRSLTKESCSTLHHVSFKQKCIRIILNQKSIGRFQWYYDSTKSSKIWIGKGCVSPFGEFFVPPVFFSFANLLSISSWTTCWFVDEHMIPTTILTQKRNSDSPKRGSMACQQAALEEEVSELRSKQMEEVKLQQVDSCCKLDDCRQNWSANCIMDASGKASPKASHANKQLFVFRGKKKMLAPSTGPRSCFPPKKIQRIPPFWGVKISKSTMFDLK